MTSGNSCMIQDPIKPSPEHLRWGGTKMQTVTEEGGNGLVSSLTGCCLDGEKLKSGLIHSQAAKGHGQVDGLGPPHADLLPCETSASWNVPVCQSCHRNTEQSRKPCWEPETEANLGRQAVTARGRTAGWTGSSPPSPAQAARTERHPVML